MNDFIYRIGKQKTLTLNGITFLNLDWGEKVTAFRYTFTDDVTLTIVINTQIGDDIVVYFKDYHMEADSIEETFDITDKTNIKDLKACLNKVLVKMKDHFVKRFIGLKQQQIEVINYLGTIGFSQYEYDNIMNMSSIPADYYEESFYREKYADNGEDN